MSRMKLMAVASLLVSVAYLSGCATGHSCPLENEDGYCADMTKTYNAAVADGGDQENVLAGSDKGNSDAKAAKPVTPPLKHKEGFHAYEDHPVYAPPRPARVWLAPWRDENNLLHSGEYIFATREGGWHYGEMKTDGSASGLLGPLDPDDIGLKLSKLQDRKGGGNKIVVGPGGGNQNNGTVEDGPWTKNNIGWSPSGAGIPK